MAKDVQPKFADVNTGNQINPDSIRKITQRSEVIFLFCLLAFVNYRAAAAMDVIRHLAYVPARHFTLCYEVHGLYHQERKKEIQIN
jgi:hypothetical protein